ncbi:tail length tape-measure protein [Sphingomonas phage Kimi]|nr:tail length tape-measure protein [Sphingomonas phage Kimi]
MSDERIDIEVNDKVDANVPKKLREIATEADRGFTYVERLKGALASINTSAVTKLAAASNATTNALARELTAQAKLTTARGQAAVANAKAATEAQRLATETARTEAAQQRAATAASNAARAALQLEAAQSRAAGGAGNLAARAHSLKAALDPAYAAQSRFNAEINEAKTLYNAGAINIRTYTAAVGAAQGKLDAAKAAQDRYNNSMRQAGKAAQLAGHHKANLVAQINDIGVSLASGQNPFIVFIQQGSQLQDLSMRVEGGFKTLAMATLRMLAPFAALAAAAGVLVGIFFTLKSRFNEASGEIDPFVKSLGLTDKELKKLGDTSITVGDMFSGLWKTIKEAYGLDAVFADVSSFFSKVWKTAIDFIYYAFVGFYGLVVGGMRGVAEAVTKLPTVTSATAKAIVNAAATAIEWIINKAIDGINWLIQKTNSITSKVGLEFGEIGQVTLPRLQRSAEETGNTLSDIMNRQVTGAILEADSKLQGFTNRWRENADAARRARLANRAAELIEERSPGRQRTGREDKTAENRAHALDMVNLKLDGELARMRLLKDERAVQQRMDQIEEQLAQKRITLTDQERLAIENKVRAIEQFKYVQSEMDRIYEESTGPLRTWNAAQEAAQLLLDQGSITLERYNQELVKSGRAYKEATDPLFQLNEAMTQAEMALGKYGVAAQQATYYEQIRQAMLKQGIELSPSYVAGLNQEVDALMRRNQALLQQQQIQSTIGQIVDPMLQEQQMLANKQLYYDELERLRQEDILSEENYNRARYELDRRFMEMRVAGAQSMFSDLATLSSSGNKKLAAIGKAAAVAQATIDGYLAVQKALAAFPPPWNIAAAAAVAIKTGAQVAGIMSTNVGSFATGGQFMVEGRSGVDANNINMNVTRGERVTVETPAQQRANDNSANGSGEPPVVNLKSINVLDPRMMLDALETAEGDQVFVNRIEANAAQVRSVLGIS